MKGSPATIAIFASGAGTNARAIVRYFAEHESIRVIRIYSNKADAGVSQAAEEAGIPFTAFSREELTRPDGVLRQLQQEGTGWIVLAGFLWKMPEHIVHAFADRIVNIHPALLPLYGGKGMYGMNVHRAVKEAGDLVSGITIHLVNEHYDEGAVIHQEKVDVTGDDTAETIAKKVQVLEHEWYPRIIERLVLSSGK